jgi:hypothetical protein
VGGEVAVHWKLPEVLVTAIRYHHGPVPEDLVSDQMNLTRVLRLGNRFAHVAGIGRREPQTGVDWAHAAENPGFPVEALKTLFARFLEEYTAERSRMAAALL